jgi:hypothetical protein
VRLYSEKLRHHWTQATERSTPEARAYVAGYRIGKEGEAGQGHYMDLDLAYAWLYQDVAHGDPVSTGYFDVKERFRAAVGVFSHMAVAPCATRRTSGPLGIKLGHGLDKPGSPLSWHSLLTPLSKDRSSYAPNKTTNHHFALGGGWRRVCGIRNDRRTRRRRPAGGHSLRTRSSSNGRSMQRPQQCEQRPCASKWHRRAWDGQRQAALHSVRPLQLFTLTVMGGGDPAEPPSP